MQGTGEGSFVFSWKQVELDGLRGCQPSVMHIGATWRWSGQAMRTDDPRDILILKDGASQSKVSARAAANVRRMFGLQVSPNTENDLDDQEQSQANSFALTDGLRVFEAVVLHDTPTASPLVLFQNGLPEPDKDYWVLRQDVVAPYEPGGEGTICFVPGTLVETDRGLVDVATLRIGDKLQTRDNGFQPLLWRAARDVSGARLLAFPDLRPIRIRANLFDEQSPMPALTLSPDHRLLLQGKSALDLFGTDEVLVRARDLLSHEGVTRLNRPTSVTYIHLMLESHQVLRANGVNCESFHPAAADMSALKPNERSALAQVNGEALMAPHSYGGFARKILDKAEAALFFSRHQSHIPKVG